MGDRKKEKERKKRDRKERKIKKERKQERERENEKKKRKVRKKERKANLTDGPITKIVLSCEVNQHSHPFSPLLPFSLSIQEEKKTVGKQDC